MGKYNLKEREKNKNKKNKKHKLNRDFFIFLSS